MGSLAAWVLDLKSQPMDLDYLYLYQADAPQPKAKAGFFDTLVHEIRSFAASFSEDYNAMGGSGGQESIDVWVGSGRDQAQIIRMMVNDLYTPSHHIGVNLKLVNAGMVEAFLSGQTPDVALTIGRGQPLNLAVRGALADLTQFEDFEKVKDWFLPGALDPYYFESGCFGLPDTQSFYMLFYRTDILEELEVAPPRTWEEFYAAIPAIRGLIWRWASRTPPWMPSARRTPGWGCATFSRRCCSSRAGAFTTRTGAGRPWAPRRRWRPSPGGVPCTRITGCRCPTTFTIGSARGNPAGHRLLHRICPAGIRGAGDPGAVGNGAHTRSGPLRRHHRPDAGGIWLRLRHPEPDGEAGGLLGFPEVVLLGGGADPLRKDVEAQMGLLARVAVANSEALASLAWTKTRLAAIEEQRRDVRGTLEVLGGYYLIRGLDNAFRDVVYEGKNPRESLVLYDKQVNGEIQRKRKEFGLE